MTLRCSWRLIAGLAFVTGCGEGTSPSEDLAGRGDLATPASAVDLARSPVQDLRTPPPGDLAAADLAPSPDLAAAQDLAIENDLAVGPDLAVSPDFAVAADLAMAWELGIRDLAAGDLSAPPDLSNRDLVTPADLRPPPDLATPRDFATRDFTAAPDLVVALPKFSFFVTSLNALQALSGSQLGFGGDLRYGEVGPGAGLRGADKLCATIAERSMKGAGKKPWRAFLSATNDGHGNVVNAVDRIGNGPWYDRLGRLFALGRDDLFYDRPRGADPVIQNDFPNEDGVPNHRPDPNQPLVDNHDMLTGTHAGGKLYGPMSTCLDWTANAGNKLVEGRPHVGHSWPRGPISQMMRTGGSNTANWMSALDESGCAPGVNLIEMGPPNPNSNTVGSGGGYGGFYCFALIP